MRRSVLLRPVPEGAAAGLALSLALLGLLVLPAAARAAGSVYVADLGGTLPRGPVVSQYDIDPLSGGLSPKTPTTVPTGGHFAARAAVTPDGKSADVSLSRACLE